MKICIQWTKQNPTDWEEIDSSEWSLQPNKGDPTSQTSATVNGQSIVHQPLRENQKLANDVVFNAPKIDNEKGWIWKISVQGVEFTADHYAVEDITETINGKIVNGCRVYIISDSPLFYGDDMFYATVWTFLPLAPDPKINNQYNTRQKQVKYAQPKMMELLEKMYPKGIITCSGAPVPFIPWDDFIYPDSNIIRHGITVSAEKNNEHENSRTPRFYYEWVEDVPDEDKEIGENNRVKIKGF